MPELQIGDTIIPYEVRFSEKAGKKRIEVTPQNVVVIAPEGDADGIDAFVNQKRRWIFETFIDLRDREAGRAAVPQRWESGAKLMYRGRRLMLNIEEGGVRRAEIECRSRFHVTVPEGLSDEARRARLRQAFNGWLRKRSLRDARKFCRRYAKRLDAELAGVELSEQQNMWGTCGKDAVVRVNWRLIQAPKFAMEYVCAHEVCHLVHRHHDDAFWDTLGEVMTDWREGKARLEKWETSTFDHRREL